MIMSKQEDAILGSKTPEEYVETSYRSKLSPAAKARLAKRWMEATGYGKADILHARNRHPHWKAKKAENSADRTKRRLAANDFSRGGAVAWDEELVGRFLDMNGKDPSGAYLMKDRELAQAFGATIPSIQYMRRKLRKVSILLGPRAQRQRTLSYMMIAESVLKKGPEAVEAALKAKKRLAEKPAVSKVKAKVKVKVAPVMRSVAKPEVKPDKKATAKKPAATAKIAETKAKPGRKAQSAKPKAKPGRKAMTDKPAAQKAPKAAKGKSGGKVRTEKPAPVKIKALAAKADAAKTGAAKPKAKPGRKARKTK